LRVIGCSKGTHIAKDIARSLKLPYTSVETRFFPDGEIYVRIPIQIDEEDVVVVQSMAKRPNDLLMEFIFVLETLKDMGVKRIIGIIPYFPYARQDERFKPGEAISLNIVTHLLERLGLELVITVDMHLHRKELESLFKETEIINVSAMEDLAEYFLENYPSSDALVIAPDSEATQWAKVFASKLRLKYLVFYKERKGDENVSLKCHLDNNYVERAIVVDDIVSTGTTLEATANVLLEHGISELYAVFTHGILVPPAEHKLSKFKELISTDTVVNPYSRVRVGGLLAKTLVKYL